MYLCASFGQRVPPPKVSNCKSNIFFSIKVSAAIKNLRKYFPN